MPLSMYQEAYSLSQGSKFSADDFLQIFSETMFLNYFTVATLGLVLVDIAGTFPEEIRYIWGYKRSLYTILYWFMRYYTPVALFYSFIVRAHTHINTNEKFCLSYFWITPVTTTIIPQMVGEVLMMMRVWALYGCKRIYLYFFVFLFLVRTAAQFAAYLGSLLTIQIISLPASIPFPGCMGVPIHYPNLLILLSCVNIFTTALLFGLTVRKFIENFRIDNNMRIRDLVEARRSTGLLGLFLRDSSTYMLCVLVAEMAFAVITTRYKVWSMVWQPVTLATYGLCSTRLVLTLRKAATAAQGSENGATFELPAYESAIFARRSQVSMEDAEPHKTFELREVGPRVTYSKPASRPVDGCDSLFSGASESSVTMQ